MTRPPLYTNGSGNSSHFCPPCVGIVGRTRQAGDHDAEREARRGPPREAGGEDAPGHEQEHDREEKQGFDDDHDGAGAGPRRRRPRSR